MSRMSIAVDRPAAVRRLIEDVKAILAADGVTRPALYQVAARLRTLAEQEQYFPLAHFPLPLGARSQSYRLYGDAADGMHLIVVRGSAGHVSPIHNHRTWAAIAGIYGQELQSDYDRVDDRSVPGTGRLSHRGELVIERGTSTSYLGEDFHAINVIGHEMSLALHLYGRDLATITDRLAFAHPEGGAYSTFIGGAAISPRVRVSELAALLADDQELAVLDVREIGAYSAAGHILASVSLPLSSVEARVTRLVPRLATRIVVTDADGGWLAAAAARKLEILGYSAVSVLDGGTEAWAASGGELFTGVNVISKAFGEHVKRAYATPAVKTEELRDWMEQGKDFVVLDSRPADEYASMTIPGARHYPGGELVYRAFDAVTSSDTTVVVNCGGRTRAIIGAQALINAGFPNPVVELENGVSGWRSNGHAPARGLDPVLTEPTAVGLAAASGAAAQVAKRFAVSEIKADELTRFAADGKRTLYVIDVRTPAEYAAGHIAGAISAPGGQLIQTTDEHIGTLRSRVVLTDGGDGIRATIAASWLLQLNLTEVYVYRPSADTPLEQGAESSAVRGTHSDADTVTPAAAKALLDAGAVTLLDLAPSGLYKSGHVPGAWFAVRSRLPLRAPVLPGSGPILLTSPDAVAAHGAATELTAANRGRRAVLVLDGGTDAWRAGGYPLEEGLSRVLDQVDDFWAPPAEPDEHRTWFVEYVRWGQELAEKIERDGTVRFRVYH
jgi:rhodanese-related sulfurtransferase/predicted metal-dependent enzyme (double-stranded beta helix superfamily)